MELLRRNRFCMGVKRGNEYRCGGEADEVAKSKAVNLIVEAIRRMRRWRVWETWWIEEWMDEWLETRDRLETQLRGKYNNEIINDITGLVDRFIGYSEQSLNYWRDVGGEAKKLLEDLLSGRSEVIIWSNEGGVSVYHEFITLEAHRTSTDGVTVQLSLEGLEGVTIRVSDVFRKTMSRKEYRKFINKVLKALKGGLEEADGFNSEGKATMGTTQTWQAIVWSLLYPGKTRAHIDNVNVNNSNVTITWCLRSSHKPLKGKILGNADKLGEEELLAFMLGVVLGDGWVGKTVITITMSDEKLKAWEPLFERLKSMGFRSAKPNSNKSSVVQVPFFSDNAIGLARAMISVLPPILRDVLDALAFEKWLNLRRIAEMEVKYRRGEMQVDVAGYKFTVKIQKGTVMLTHWTKDDAEVKKVINALRARYGDEFHAYVNRSGKYLIIRIPMHVFEEYDDIKAQVIKVLCKKLEKTKDEKKKQIITKHLMRLTTPTKEAAAANHTQPSLPWTQYRCTGAIW